MPTFTKKIPTADGHRVVERTTDDPAEANSLRYSGWQQTADPADAPESELEPGSGAAVDPAGASESEPEPGSGAAVDPAGASESEPEPEVEPGPGTELSLIPAPSEDPDGHAAD